MDRIRAHSCFVTSVNAWLTRSVQRDGGRNATLNTDKQIVPNLDGNIVVNTPC